MDILIVTRNFNNPPQTGGELRTVNLIRALREIPSTRLHVLYWPHGGSESLRVSQMDNVKITVCSDELKFANEIEDNYSNFDAVQVEGFDIYSYCESIPKPIILNEHNIEYEVAAQLGDIRAEEWRIKEPLVWKKVDAVITCSKRDRDVVRSSGSSCVICIPNVLDIDEFTTNNIRKINDKIILFSGKFDYAPNRQGLDWFLKYVWNKVFYAIPQVELVIAGRNAKRFYTTNIAQRIIVRDGPSISEMMELEANASVVIAPLLSGGGTKYKIIRALLRGCPIVATEQAVLGFDEEEVSLINIANSPADFAEKVINAVKNDTYRTSKSDLILLTQKYNWRNYVRVLRDLYNDILALKY